MANRILRDWTDSERVNELSIGAEVFFTRLIMKADDYGCYHGSTKLLRASLFPLRIDSIREADLQRWIAECVKAGLIVLYDAADKPFVEIVNFNQRLRAMKRRFPQNDSALPSSVSVSRSDDRIPPPETETETETESETETETETEGAARLLIWPTFEQFWDKYGKKVDRVKCEKKWEKVPQRDREKIMVHLDAYIPATPDLKFRRDPATYLNNRSWENEIITNGHTTAKITRDDRNRYFETKYGIAGAAKG